MGKKREARKKFEVPREAKEKAECLMAMQMFRHCSELEIYQALVECEMDFDGAMRRLSNQEKEKTRAGVPAEWKEQVERIKEIVKEMEPKFTEEEIYETLKRCNMDPDLATQRLANFLVLQRVDAQESKSQHGVSSSSSSSVVKQGGSRDDDVGRTDTTHDDTVQGIQGNSPRFSIQSIGNDSPDLPFSAFDHMTYGSMEHPAMMSMNAPPLTPSASIHQSPQTLLQDTNLSAGHGFTHPYIEPSYYQPQLPLQHGYMNGDGHVHQNFGYDLTSPQQEVYQGGSSSWANADPSSWGSFLDRGSIPHQFLPNSPAPSDSSGTQLNSTLHVQAQHQHRNDYWPDGTKYNFAVLKNQLNPGAMSAHPEQQQSGFPEQVPLPSDGNNQHHDMPSAQQEMHQGGCSSWANGNASGWGSIQGTGNTSYQSPPIPPYSPSPFNISRTSNDPTLQAQDQYRNDHHFLKFPGLASTPGGSFPGGVPLPANARNQHAGEGSSPQYDHQGYPSWHHPGTRVSPNHLQQSPYNTGTGDSQDLSTMQPP
ncbi:uncharacterized protein LOC115685792 [Syzygium oleosum]|uniref:uncharacterized protein LOC115685792 n=1 Tax=Syzygium oleosum TaxID=219896 RepID=UPI0024BA4083|nr:uncharacterized protein LOC115685792 [Syzygium oleosum]